MDQETIKYLLLFVVSFNFIFEKIINYLNVKKKMGPIPVTLQGFLDVDKLKESKAYQRAGYQFGLITGTFTFIITLILIGFGVFGWLDEWLRLYIQNPMLLTLAYFSIVFIGSDILSIPFDYYHTFKIENDFGFNNSTVKTFFLDKAKGYLLSIIIGGALLATLLWLILELGHDFWWIFWIVASLFMLLANLFYAGLILPLFNKLTPLEEGELKDAITSYANSVDFSLKNVFVMDGSKRSSKANAFFSGFGKRKKVVLFDTLIKQHTQEELVAVLAHEIGHYQKGHIKTGMLAGILQTGLMLYILSLFIFSEPLSLALGGNQMAIHLNIIAFSILFTPISMILGMGMNYLSRKNEFEADAFAKTTYSGPPLAKALKTLSVKTLSDINPHPLYVFINYSHPPLLKRLAKLE
ncbi:M48 family metallopeptidase [Cyclobacterium qasimii]|uniref:Peptidase M48 n=2 Tax=Cyclobacterium qasimii TaxID=1350429 RepID=A0A512CHR4_9BACT|nr:M48 family metallopeptidase [Cyclobacterium qasimii]EPR68428.1 putative CAAX prenyl protease 1 [Cyclobacterium qasimii M12-11B]GEO23758.1 peptidase M48 [Cyclobacterium qasimii]